ELPLPADRRGVRLHPRRRRVRGAARPPVRARVRVRLAHRRLTPPLRGSGGARGLRPRRLGARRLLGPVRRRGPRRLPGRGPPARRGAGGRAGGRKPRGAHGAAGRPRPSHPLVRRLSLAPGTADRRWTPRQRGPSPARSTLVARGSRPPWAAQLAPAAAASRRSSPRPRHHSQPTCAAGAGPNAAAIAYGSAGNASQTAPSPRITALTPRKTNIDSLTWLVC